MEILQSISLDFGRDTLPITVFAKQNDQNSRFVKITPLNCGQTYTLDSGITARLQLTKPDGHTVIDDATIENNTITAELTAQVLAAAGMAVAEIGLYKNDALLSSQVFYIDIKKAAYDMEAVESSDEYNSLVDALGRVDGAVEAANTAASAANTAAQGANLTAGDGIDIEDGEISVDDTVARKSDLTGKQDKITAGTGITFTNNKVSVNTSTIQQKMTAGTGITISSNKINVNTSIIQTKLYAGDGVRILGNTIFGYRHEVLNSLPDPDDADENCLYLVREGESECSAYVLHETEGEIESEVPCLRLTLVEGSGPPQIYIYGNDTNNIATGISVYWYAGDPAEGLYMANFSEVGTINEIDTDEVKISLPGEMYAWYSLANSTVVNAVSLSHGLSRRFLRIVGGT